MSTEELLNKLSPEERKIALGILNEVGTKGTSKKLDELKYADYKEIPVDIETFLTDDRYLGKAWKGADGKSKVYPFWLEQLKRLFPTNIDTDYNTLLQSGARGIGKSETAYGAVCPYLMYRVMCLKNPHEYYDIKLDEKIVFAFMNIKKDLTEKIAVDKFQKTIQMSPWFMAQGTMTQRNNRPYWNPPDPIDIVVGSQSDDVIGQPIYFAAFDEISFIKNKDVDEQKKKALDMIDTALGGMRTRFINKDGKNPTMLVVASSKRSEQSFMESYIRQLSETQGENTLVVDEAVWDVKPKGTYSTETFFIGLGDKFKESIIIPDKDKDNLQEYKDKGYKIVEAPIDFKAKALEGLDRMLCDYAGISSFSSNKFLNASRVMECVSDEVENPLPDVITVGDDRTDTAQYKDFFDMSKIKKELKDKPLFIHLDMSTGAGGLGDKTGIVGVWIIGKKPTSDGNPGKDLFYQIAFSTSVAAPKGRRISFEKNRNFIRWLREEGFNIREVTADTFQSTDLLQILAAEGFKTNILSVDRVEVTPGEHIGICRPYQYLQSTINEGRLRLYKTDLLYEELTLLEKNNNNGKIDHQPKGCFTGDTKVKLVDGRELSFFELVREYEQGKENYVYSINLNTHKVEAKKILKAWQTLKNQQLVRITFDNNEYVECTLNHKFMLRNGSYIEARDLIVGDSLMPLYTKISGKGLKGYRMYYNPFEDEWHYEHRSFALNVYDTKYLVHHINFNKLDNSPTNLIWMSASAHHALHTLTCTGASSHEANKKRSESIRKWHANNKDTEMYRVRNKKLHDYALKQHGLTEEDYIKAKELCKQHSIELKNAACKRAEALLQHIQDIETTFNVVWKTLSLKEKNSYGVKYANLQHPEIRLKVNVKISENHKKGKYENAKKALSKHDKHIKELKSMFPIIDREQFRTFFDFDFDSLPKSNKGPWANRYRQRLYELINHKVTSIEFIVKTADVYDIEVEDNHNFALACGVFVHNSKDQSDGLCGAVYTASKYAEEFAHDYGETMESIFEVNKDTEAQTQKQMIVDFEKELEQMNDYSRKQREQMKKEEEGRLPFSSDIMIY